MQDEFSDLKAGLSSPASHAEAVVAHDLNELSNATRALYVGNGGNVRVKLLSGDLADFSNVPSGAFLPVRVVQVFATGTSASDILGLY